MTEPPNNDPESPLLPNEPRVPGVAQQRALTERFLLPRLVEIEALLRGIRGRLDAPLARAQPRKANKPYPLGQGLDISLAVKQELTRLRQSDLTGPAGRDHAALVDFLSHGGQMRQVWGDLRGAYCQNAFLAGTLYIDVANDSVFAKKPPVEILPFERSGLVAIRDCLHFGQLARRYWGGELYPNHLFPQLGPWFPWISVVPGAGVQLEAGNDFMIALTRRDRFCSAQQVLEQAAPPQALATAIAAQVAAADCGFHSRGQEAALAQCAELRATPPDDAQRDRMARQFLAINRRLAAMANKVTVLSCAEVSRLNLAEPSVSPVPLWCK
ncbi:hypothetical protein Thiowin_00449 [Thiorhodovibrio winogradskyi]|uniref:Uncharacterized protein n=1 Tax=Thiorhodovibrio winogradskyi TaxID=77007 RepID=A0ABZ0S316_9GAMM|nr:hypothetical protein [Thiorhodovibrio winogradskyi]